MVIRTKLSKMMGVIKPNKLRLEFESLLRDLGYRDRSPLYFCEKETKQINYMCSDGAMGIYNTIIVYFNKKSYLYSEFNGNYGSPFIKERISTLAENIHFNEKTRVGEVSWKVIYTKQPTEFTLEQRKKIFYAFIKDTYDHFNNGMLGLKPRVGDVLVSNPYGPKINQGFSEHSLEIGTRQRASLSKKLGFSEMKPDGFCYARYDENLRLRPL